MRVGSSEIWHEKISCMNHSISHSFYPSIYPSVPFQTSFTASESIRLLLFAARALLLWLTLHSSRSFFSLLLSNPSLHALLHCSSCLSSIRQASGERARQGKAKKKKTELKGGKTNWWWSVRKRRAIKWAKTEAWWDGEVASLLQSDIAEWGRAERIDGFRRHRAIKRQRSIKSGVLGRTRVQQWFKWNFIVCVMMAFVGLSLCVCNHFNIATRLFALKQASLWWTCEPFREINFTVCVCLSRRKKKKWNWLNLFVRTLADSLQVSIYSLYGVKGR